MRQWRWETSHDGVPQKENARGERAFSVESTWGSSTWGFTGVSSYSHGDFGGLVEEPYEFVNSFR